MCKVLKKLCYYGCEEPPSSIRKIVAINAIYLGPRSVNYDLLLVVNPKESHDDVKAVPIFFIVLCAAYIKVMFLFLVQKIYRYFTFFIVGVVIFYVCIIVYLYGDLAIYAAAVPKSLRDVIW